MAPFILGHPGQCTCTLGTPGANLEKRRLRVFMLQTDEAGGYEDDESWSLSSSFCNHSSPARTPRRPPTVTLFPQDVVRSITSHASTARPGGVAVSSTPTVLMMARPARPAAAACLALLPGLLLLLLHAGVATASA